MKTATRFLGTLIATALLASPAAAQATATATEIEFRTHDLGGYDGLLLKIHWLNETDLTTLGDTVILSYCDDEGWRLGGGYEAIRPGLAPGESFVSTLTLGSRHVSGVDLDAIESVEIGYHCEQPGGDG